MMQTKTRSLNNDNSIIISMYRRTGDTAIILNFVKSIDRTERMPYQKLNTRLLIGWHIGFNTENCEFQSTSNIIIYRLRLIMYLCFSSAISPRPDRWLHWSYGHRSGGGEWIFVLRRRVVVLCRSPRSYTPAVCRRATSW